MVKKQIENRCTYYKFKVGTWVALYTIQIVEIIELYKCNIDTWAVLYTIQIILEMLRLYKRNIATWAAIQKLYDIDYTMINYHYYFDMNYLTLQ